MRIVVRLCLYICTQSFHNIVQTEVAGNKRTVAWEREREREKHVLQTDSIATQKSNSSSGNIVVEQISDTSSLLTTAMETVCPCFLPVMSYRRDLQLLPIISHSLLLLSFSFTCVIPDTRMLVKAIGLKHRWRTRISWIFACESDPSGWPVTPL